MCSSIKAWEVVDDSTSRGRGTTNTIIAISNASSRTNFPSRSSELQEDQSAECTFMRERIKTALYQKAVDFKVEVNKGMEDVRTKLLMALNEVKSDSNFLIQDQEVKDAAMIGADYETVLSIENYQKDQLINVQRILAEVEEYGKKFVELKDKWELFRTNFKGEVVEVIKRELEKQRQNAKPEDILDWTYFMPEIVVNDLGYETSASTPGSTRVLVKYFE